MAVLPVSADVSRGCVEAETNGIAADAQKPEEADSVLSHKMLNVEFCFDDKKKNKSFQTLSVSLCDAGVVEIDTINANAVADLLLSSEIRGYVENPNYYFENPTPRVDAELDLLMLTQGWRRYDIDSMVNRRYPSIQYDIEEWQSISGRVEHAFNKNPKNMQLLLLSPMVGVKESFDLKGNNRFRITNLDFVDGTPFTVQATTEKGRTNIVRVIMDEEVFPDIHAKDRRIYTSQKPTSIQSTAVDFYNKSKLHDEIKEKMKQHLLPEVVVKGYKRTWYNPSGLKPTSMLKEGDFFLDHAGYSGTVVQRLGLVLRSAEGFNGDDVVDERFGKYHVTGRGKVDLVAPVLYIDDFPADQEELLTMPPENISRIEFYGRGSGLNINSDPFWKKEYLFVYTKPIARINNYTLSMKNVKPLGYKQSCEFYHPQYGSHLSIYPDYRTTYYWNPSLQASPGGKWTFGCLVPSRVKKMLLTVEGVGEDGSIVSMTQIIAMP